MIGFKWEPLWYADNGDRTPGEVCYGVWEHGKRLGYVIGSGMGYQQWEAYDNDDNDVLGYKVRDRLTAGRAIRKAKQNAQPK